MSKKRKYTKKELAHNGKSIGGGSIPYGYRTNRHNYLVPYKKEEKVVKTIYKLVLEGYTLREIAEDLNDRKIPTKRGKSWSYQQVKQLIQNSAYNGKRKYKDEFVPIRRMVPAKVWEDANERISSRINAKHRDSKTYQNYLKGVLYCWDTEELYSSRWDSNSNRGRYFHQSEETGFRSVDSHILHRGIEDLFNSFYQLELEHIVTIDDDQFITLFESSKNPLGEGLLLRRNELERSILELRKAHFNLKPEERLKNLKEIRKLRTELNRIIMKLGQNDEYYSFSYLLAELKYLSNSDKNKLLKASRTKVWVKKVDSRIVVVDVELNHFGFQSEFGMNKGFEINYRDPKHHKMTFF